MNLNIFTYTFPIDVDASSINTVGDLKIALNGSGYDISSTKLILSNGQLVSPEVFTTDKYDNISLDLKGASAIVFPKDKLPNKTPNIVTTSPITYYVIPDTGYEGSGPLKMPTSRRGNLIAINHQSVNKDYDEVVKYLFNKIPFTIKICYDRSFTNHAIFKVNDLKSNTTIAGIIDAVIEMDCCEVWGTKHDIKEYQLDPNTVLVHLQLKEVESG